ncbi:MAG: response regulator [Candidatus Peribacteraceae bacterium]|nr:response regulator [Candidatus Peribacteraceae bacterium]
MPTPNKDTEKKAPRPTTESAAAKPAKGAKKILIVEDERPLAHALELKFRHEGYDTHIAMDGVEALEEAKKNHYDVILLDLIMPRMDGFSFMQELKDQKQNTPIIILSNLGQDEDRQRAKDLGALEYYVKSNTPIIDIVKRVSSVA